MAVSNTIAKTFLPSREILRLFISGLGLALALNSSGIMLLRSSNFTANRNMMAGSLIRAGSWTSSLQKEKEKAVYLLLRSISTTVSELGIDESTGITKPVGIHVVEGIVVV